MVRCILPFSFILIITIQAMLLMQSNLAVFANAKEPNEWIKAMRKKRDFIFEDNGDHFFSKIINHKSVDRLGKWAHGIVNSDTTVQLGYGFVMGYSSGYCLKKVGKLAAFAIGGLFVIIQTLSFNGYIQVNDSKLKHDVKVK